MVKLVNEQSIVILFIFLQFVNLFIPSCAKNEEIKMFPIGKERVVDVGIAFNITCKHFTLLLDPLDECYNITWSLPRIYDEDTNLMNRLNKTWDFRSERKFAISTTTSTLTFFNATSEQTGYYSCDCLFFDPFRRIDAATQYVYVKGEKLLTMATYKFESFADNGVKSNKGTIYADEKSDITIPCIATQPNVTISYYRITLVMMLNRTDLKEILFNNIQISNSTKSKYANDRTSGLTIKNAGTSDSGLYKCGASLGNAIDELLTLLMVKGMELTMIGGNQMIEEGSNVTLICSAFPLHPPRILQWRYGGKLNITNYIDEKNPPKDLPLLQERTHYRYSRDYLEMPFKKFKMDTDEYDFGVSELRLFNVTRQSLENNYFECAETLDRYTSPEKTSNGISLRIKSNEKDENVRIEMGRKQTITCTTTANATNFQWFKDKQPINTTGDGQPTAAQLTLEGVPDDVGLYECNYVDKYGDLQRRTFVVTAAPNESNQDTIALFVGLPLAIVSIALAVALLWFCCRRRKVFPNAEKLLEGIQETNVYYRQKEEEARAQPYDKRWEFPRNRLKLGKELGAGCFGRVLKGEAISINDRAATNDITTTVAVKMIKSRSLDAYRELETLVAELKIMTYLGPHLNVVSLLGACTKNITKGELLVILEYCPFGNLQSFLNDPHHEFNDGLDDGYVDAFQGERIRCSGYLPMQTSSVSAGTTVQSSPPAMEFGEQDTSTSATKVQLNSGGNITSGEPTRLTYSTRNLISWSWQITRGMRHLANKKVVHGDLAARNVLLSNNGVVKVADFGLARRTYYKEYCTSEGMGPMPMKWMAIESLTNNTFTSQSDVWSYGVTLWELFSLGKSPYPGIEWKKLVSELESGFRMEKPSNAPNFIGEIMNSCWEMEPKERPTFQQLEETLSKHLHSSVSSYYLQLDIASLSNEQC